MVECQLPKLDVAGSNPVSRSEHYRSSQRSASCPRAEDVVAYFALIGFAEVFYVVVFSLFAFGDWMGC